MKPTSVVIPVFNSDETLVQIVSELEAVRDSLNLIQIVLVNDGSSNTNTDNVCVDLFRTNNLITYIELSKNFGEHNAVMAGLSMAIGEYIIIMDDDLQNPPSEAVKLVRSLDQSDADVTYACYEVKRHSAFRNIGSNFNNFVASFLLEKPTSLYMSSFKALRKSLVTEILRYVGPSPYIDGLILQSTKRYTQTYVTHTKRAKGASNYTIKKLISLWLRMGTNFSVLPLRISSIFGMILGTICLFLTAWIAVEKMSDPEIPLGYTSVITAVLLIGSLQMFALGIIGEYLGKVLLTLNNKPQYIVRKSLTR